MIICSFPKHLISASVHTTPYDMALLWIRQVATVLKVPCRYGRAYIVAVASDKSLRLVSAGIPETRLQMLLVSLHHLPHAKQYCFPKLPPRGMILTTSHFDPGQQIYSVPRCCCTSRGGNCELSLNLLHGENPPMICLLVVWTFGWR